MSIFDAVVLGIVQGLTEFIPVSSTGHLVLMHEVLGANVGDALAFDAMLHLATLLAVFLYFFPDVWQLVQALLRKLGRLPVNPKDEVLLKALLIGTLPAVVLGLMFETFITETLRSPLAVAFVLIISAFFFVYVEWMYSNTPRSGEVSVKTGFKIGLFQVLALLPGFSRSGATIGGGMLLGFTRYDAAKFSFLLSMPVILGVGCKKLLDLLVSEEVIQWAAIGAGSLTAFVVAFFTIHIFLGFTRKHTLWPFVWYKLILAVFILAVFWFS